jgi:hypothetical protein
LTVGAVFVAWGVIYVGTEQTRESASQQSAKLSLLQKQSRDLIIQTQDLQDDVNSIHATQYYLPDFMSRTLQQQLSRPLKVAGHLTLSQNEGRKRVLGIIAGILVARHLKTTEDLFDGRTNPRTESLVVSAVQWAERIMRKVDNLCSSK